MREIKFKAWDTQNKKWHKLKYRPAGEVREISCFREDDEVMVLLSSEHTIWCQFTGLKDKNGKEIYEGNILAQAGYENRLVKWESMIDYEGTEVGIGYAISNDYELKEIEVIGNIYENPELLKDLTSQVSQP